MRNLTNAQSAKINQKHLKAFTDNFGYTPEIKRDSNSNNFFFIFVPHQPEYLYRAESVEEINGILYGAVIATCKRF